MTTLKKTMISNIIFDRLYPLLIDALSISFLFRRIADLYKFDFNIQNKIRYNLYKEVLSWITYTSSLVS